MKTTPNFENQKCSLVGLKFSRVNHLDIIIMIHALNNIVDSCLNLNLKSKVKM